MKFNISDIHHILANVNSSGAESGDLVRVAVARILAYSAPLPNSHATANEAFEATKTDFENAMAPINEHFPIDFDKTMALVKALFEVRYNLAYPSSVLQVAAVVDPVAAASGVYGNIDPADPRINMLVAELAQ